MRRRCRRTTTTTADTRTNTDTDTNEDDDMAPSTASAAVADPAYYTSAMSYAEWKREPTTAQVLFGLQLPYRPPRSPLAHFVWRRRVWVEVTFALSMLEPWEKFLVSE